MAPYFVLALIAAMLGFFLCELHPSRRNDFILIMILSIIMFIMSVLRDSSVGVDYQLYLERFAQVCEGGLPFVFSFRNEYWTEIGYSLLEYIISLFGKSQMAYATGIALVCLVLNAVFVYRHSSSVWLSMFVFISFGIFGYTLCTIRHQIAIAIYLFALPYLQKKQFIPYCLITLAAMTFHKSMFVLIPMYFLAQLALTWKTYLFYTVCLLAYYAFSETLLPIITPEFYQGYSVGSYYMLGRDIPTMVIPVLFFLVVALFQKPLLERNPQNLPLIKVSLYCAVLFIMTLKHFIFQRFALILLPVAMLLLPEINRCVAIAPEQQAELDSLKAAVKAGTGNKKVNLQRYNEKLAQLKDKRAMYYASIGFMLFFGFLYMGWILSANRLLIVPYIIQSNL